MNKKKLTVTNSLAAQRAIEEAKLRNCTKINKELPHELGGRDGPEPTRFGDWEKKRNNKRFLK
jgi:hypothetical protein